MELHCPATLAQAPVADGLPAGWVLHGAPAELRLDRAILEIGTGAWDMRCRNDLIFLDHVTRGALARYFPSRKHKDSIADPLDCRQIRDIADAMVANGMKDAGYR